MSRIDSGYRLFQVRRLVYYVCTHLATQRYFFVENNVIKRINNALSHWPFAQVGRPQYTALFIRIVRCTMFRYVSFTIIIIILGCFGELYWLYLYYVQQAYTHTSANRLVHVYKDILILRSVLRRKNWVNCIRLIFDVIYSSRKNLSGVNWFTPRYYVQTDATVRTV